jgi:hypothetical protein
MQSQVLNLVRAVNFELRRIGSVRKYLSNTAAAAQTLVSAFILSRIDYCNYGCPQYPLNSPKTSEQCCLSGLENPQI